MKISGVDEILCAELSSLPLKQYLMPTKSGGHQGYHRYLSMT